MTILINNNIPVNKDNNNKGRGGREGDNTKKRQN